MKFFLNCWAKAKKNLSFTYSTTDNTSQLRVPNSTTDNTSELRVPNSFYQPYAKFLKSDIHCLHASFIKSFSFPVVAFSITNLAKIWKSSSEHTSTSWRLANSGSSLNFCMDLNWFIAAFFSFTIEEAVPSLNSLISFVAQLNVHSMLR